jgi:hypothetical protein
VKTARTATAGHRREPIEQQRFALRGERAGLLVPHVDELDTTRCQVGGKGVQRVADDAVAVLDTGLLHGIDNDSCYFLTHC